MERTPLNAGLTVGGSRERRTVRPPAFEGFPPQMAFVTPPPKTDPTLTADEEGVVRE